MRRSSAAFPRATPKETQLPGGTERPQQGALGAALKASPGSVSSITARLVRAAVDDQYAPRLTEWQGYLLPHPGLTKMQVEEITAAFAKYDADKSGELDLQLEATPSLNYLGHVLREELLEPAIAQFAYSTVNFGEYLQFVTSYRDLEATAFRSQFESYDLDQSGEISTKELMGLMSGLGYTPTKLSVEEALTIVDTDKTGTVSFKEFMLLMRIYRVTEGFTAAELEELKGTFNKFDRDISGEISTDELFTVIQYLGYKPRSLEAVALLVKELDADQSGSLNASEFRKFMRRYREVHVREVREIFAKHDVDQSGEISIQELEAIIRSLGYTPSGPMVREALTMVDADGTGEIGFDELLTLMGIYRETNGFTALERKEYQEIFRKHDRDRNEEISVIELGWVLRYLGLSCSLGLQQELVAEVDVDKSGQLNFPEFLKLMRVYKEREEAELLQVFHARVREAGRDPTTPITKPEEAKEKGEPDPCWLSVPELLDLLHRMEIQPILSRRFLAMTRIEFGVFADLVKKARAAKLASIRWRLGFSEQEVEDFRHCFEAYDTDRSGTISRGEELLQVLKDLGREPRDAAQQAQLLQLLMEIPTGPGGDEEQLESSWCSSPLALPSTISFPDFLYLMRRFFDEHEAVAIEKEERYRDRAQIPKEEVPEFRRVFEEFLTPDAHELAFPGILRMLTKAGVGRLREEQMDELRDVVAFCDEDISGGTDFPEFLLLMRKLLDADFGGIRTKTAAKHQPKSRPADVRPAKSADVWIRNGGAPGSEQSDSYHHEQDVEVDCHDDSTSGCAIAIAEEPGRMGLSGDDALVGGAGGEGEPLRTGDGRVALSVE